MNDDGTHGAHAGPRRASRATHGLKIVTDRGPDPVPAAQREAGAPRAPRRRCRRALGGDFRAIVYENDIDHVDHVALVKGEIRPDDAVLVRVHSECLTGDAFGSLRCDCGEQLAGGA